MNAIEIIGSSEIMLCDTFEPFIGCFYKIKFENPIYDCSDFTINLIVKGNRGGQLSKLPVIPSINKYQIKRNYCELNNGIYTEKGSSLHIQLEWIKGNFEDKAIIECEFLTNDEFNEKRRNHELEMGLVN
jgi:hypothetical protein